MCSGAAKQQAPVLAKKHTGMRVCIEGALSRMARTKSDRFMAGEIVGHLKIMATRYYQGDTSVVDEFLQAYGLDKDRPE
jgi:hypothetical protein